MREGLGPDFVGIGAQKAGTTWLYENLVVQPGVWMPPVKEIHFFNRLCPHESLLGVETRGLPPFPHRYRTLLHQPSLARFRWLRRFYFGALSTPWYYSLFPPDQVGPRLAGDITPAYSTLDERGVALARRVLKPGCRVFLIVRNPIERAWSALKMHHRWLGTEISAQEVAGLLEKTGEPTHRLRSDYARTVRLWRAAFGDDLAVFRYEQLSETPRTFLRDVLGFIGVQGPVEVGTLGKRSNADPERKPMPNEVFWELRALYRSRIEEANDVIPGVADDWLGSPKVGSR